MFLNIGAEIKMDNEEKPSACDRARLRKLEKFMQGRGYERDRHGFWSLPGSSVAAGQNNNNREDQS
jgi:hypothetical protein